MQKVCCLYKLPSYFNSCFTGVLCSWQLFRCVHTAHTHISVDIAMGHFSKRKQKAYRKRYYSNNADKALQRKSLNYKCNADLRKESDRESYLSRSASKRRTMQTYKALNRATIRSAMRDAYASNSAPQKEAVRQRYTSNPSPKKRAARKQYRCNPAPQIIAVKRRYASNPDANKKAARMRYLRFRSAILHGRRKQYYASMLYRRAARLRHHALHRSRDNEKSRAYYKQNKDKVLIPQKARYFLTEPKTDKKELLKNSIASQSALRKKLLCAFKGSRQPLAEKIKESKLTKAVLNIASRKLLHNVLKLRKQSAGELLKCNALTMTATDFGESHHIASSEPFFYDQSYRLVKHTSPIAVDDNGRCVISEEVGQRDSKTECPLKWKCTAECKLPASNEAQCIVAVKALFEEPVHKLRGGVELHR